jgi:hypothetical protein
MIPKLESAEYAGGYGIRVRFADGRTGEVDLANELWGEVFEPLKNVALFRAFRVNQEFNTIEWDNGADLAPEYLYENTTAQHAASAGGPTARR